MLKLGIRQRRMLADLKTYGNGKWPALWRFRSEHKRILESLAARGLVTRADRFAELTPSGRLMADYIRPTPGRTA